MKKIYIILFTVLCIICIYSAVYANKEIYVSVLSKDILEIQDDYLNNKDYSYKYEKFKRDLSLYEKYLLQNSQYDILLQDVNKYVEEALCGNSTLYNLNMALNFIKWTYELSANRYAGIE